MNQSLNVILPSILLYYYFRNMGKYLNQAKYYPQSKKHYRVKHLSDRSSTRRHRKIKKSDKCHKNNSCSSYFSSQNSSYYQSSSSNSSLSSSSGQRSNKVDHFKYRKGQRLNGRYKVIRLMGDGTFGRVLECRKNGKYYAIKVIKPVEKYIDSAKTQRQIIKKINNYDKDDRYGIVRYKKSFEYDGFFCMVFKPLGKSLYEFIKMNNYKGFPLYMIQSFFRQILRSIGFLHRVGYTHTDLKPENILLQSGRYVQKYHRNSRNNQKYFVPSNDKIRIIDFGGATHQNQYHSRIINTRQYRSPQVILQCCQWNQISDVWSIGCIICQLYTGQLLFKTHENQEHLAMIEKNCGNYPYYMIDRTTQELRHMFYNDKINQERLSKKQISSILQMKTVRQIFQGQPQLTDLVYRCLEIDPKKRISCEDALRHQFFSLRLVN